VIGQTTQVAYTDAMNADQYNPNPIWVRGNSTDPDNRTLANYVRFDNIQPDAAGDIVFEWETPTTGFPRGLAVNAIQLLLNAVPPPDPPVLVLGPQPTETLLGNKVEVTVEATGLDLTYQWRKDGRNLMDGGTLSGANTATLTINGFAESDVGFYSVVVANSGGSLVTAAAKVKAIDPDRTMTDTLTVHYKLDETSGTAVANSGSDPENGTLVDFAEWGAGQINNAIEFFGDSGYILMDDFTKITEEVTVSGWVNTLGSASTTDPTVAFIRNAGGSVDPDNNPTRGQFELGLTYDATAVEWHLSAAIASGPNEVRVTDPDPFPLQSWQHVAFTADGGQVRLYRNGQLVARTSYIDPINPQAVDWMSIGARLVVDATLGPIPDPTNPNYMNGQLDDFAMWLFAWDQEAIQSIYTQGQAGQSAESATPPVVEVVPPDAEVSLDIVLGAGGDITLSWSGAGTLQETDALQTAGATWADSANQDNPQTITPAGGQKYYRVAGP
jgi:hypothetical protein